ncbi:MAG TPA: hypothetical protein VFF86_07565 [Candidatus Methylomirabilis sp.]|nr:hypothetical protein [Candidatus Methylomirabilis sp.]
MRPVRFQADTVVALLRRKRIATIEQLKAALGTSVDMTVFRKLREIRYQSSYSHRGRYYTLDEVARFDERGLWSCRDIHFSRWGSLVDTVERFVNDAEQGLFASELARMVQVDVEGPLLGLVRKRRLAREKVSGAYLYCARDSARRRAQILARELGPPSEQQQRRDLVLDQSKAALVLLLSTLDERQRRLFTGLESMLLGRGGDRRIAEITGLDVHTIAKGRRELLEGKLLAERIRHPGGGRKAVEKKRPE